MNADYSYPNRIKISFSIADVDQVDQDADSYADDKAQYDEEESDLADAQSGGAQSKGTIGQGRTKDRNFNAASLDRAAPGGTLDPEDDESAGADEEEQRAGFPARVDVTIEKKGKGALRIETTIQDGQVLIDKVSYYPKPELADAQTAEVEWSTRNLHTGPPFGNLDEDLQLLMERYLDERGVNTEFALWVPEYIDFKEQREYLKWLSSKLTMLVVVRFKTNDRSRRQILCGRMKRPTENLVPCKSFPLQGHLLYMEADPVLYLIEKSRGPTRCNNS